MSDPEIILNLWYVMDDLGVIYSLRARAYLGWGNDEENLAFLQEFAMTDYLIARPFAIPKKFHYHGQSVVLKSVWDQLGSRLALFEDAIQQLHKELPSQTPFDIPKSPLVCITPLYGDDSGNIRPYYTDIERL
jgi:hypothetical protein